MNTKNNSRKRASVHRIETVFMRLLQKKELSRITVTEICKLSAINRSTFYANFLDVYDLADKIREKLRGEVEKTYSVNFKEENKGLDYHKIFEHVEKNQILYQTYFKLTPCETYSDTFYDQVLAEKSFRLPDLKYHAAFFQAGFNAVSDILGLSHYKKVVRQPLSIFCRKRAPVFNGNQELSLCRIKL